ncbi:MAG: DUF4376 domain-containing protein [Sporomusaceae bacterium]|nr:DUF4376 domain-containing protein [Sporomusaceae bacterium]
MSKFYMHRNGFLYNGDMTAGSREATSEEVASHLGMSMSTRKAALRAAINAERDRREQGGFEYEGKRFDSDATSVIRINAAVNTAVAAVLTESPFTVDWTAADNTTMALDAAGFMALSMALAAHSNEQHVRARALKEQLDQAEDEAAVAMVDHLLQEWQQEA